jgi:hypothetical protein
MVRVGEKKSRRCQGQDGRRDESSSCHAVLGYFCAISDFI